ncbi:MAG TPA: hypothetical protein VH062_01350 [Polyangiaceae bacterium]|nr:hypothetical protein [Polyangiaceae bacterium]
MTVAASSDLRTRAFTLFVNAYDQVRRAVSYLRWDDDDAGTVAPSLYVRRGNGKKKPDLLALPPFPAPVPIEPVPSPSPSLAPPSDPGSAGAPRTFVG